MKTFFTRAASLLSAAAFVLLSACGGRGLAEAPQVSPPVVSPEPPTPPVVIEPAPLYPSVLVMADATYLSSYDDQEFSVIDRLASTYPGAVDNRGVIRRSTTHDVVVNSLLSTTNADVVLIMQAITDSTNVPADVYRENLRKTINVVRYAGKTPVFMASTPIVAGGLYSLERNEEHRRVLEGWKQRVAEEHGLIYCPHVRTEWTLKEKPDGISPFGAPVQEMVDDITRCLSRVYAK